MGQWMKRKVGMAILSGFLALASTAPAIAESSRNVEGNDVGISRLPKALDSFYPPAQSRPVYLFKMLDLEVSFSGIVADLTEGDVDGARGSFKEFQGQFLEAGDMVPEWKGWYPVQEVAELGVALAAGDTSLAMKSVAAVGGICHRCHQATMVPVQQKYRWGNMGGLSVNDPLGGAVTGYAQFKGSMAANLAGITVNLKQGQPGNARKQFEAFRARFQALGESCNRCHENGGRYYTGGDMQDTLENIGRALSNGSPDAKSVTLLVQKIGGESCSKCHLVHVPAAIAASSRR